MPVTLKRAFVGVALGLSIAALAWVVMIVAFVAVQPRSYLLTLRVLDEGHTVAESANCLVALRNVRENFVARQPLGADPRQRGVTLGAFLSELVPPGVYTVTVWCEGSGVVAAVERVAVPWDGELKLKVDREVMREGYPTGEEGVSP